MNPKFSFKENFHPQPIDFPLTKPKKEPKGDTKHIPLIIRHLFSANRTKNSHKNDFNSNFYGSITQTVFFCLVFLFAMAQKPFTIVMLIMLGTEKFIPSYMCSSLLFSDIKNVTKFIYQCHIVFQFSVIGHIHILWANGTMCIVCGAGFLGFHLDTSWEGNFLQNMRFSFAFLRGFSLF